jgi:hypothetical protein
MWIQDHINSYEVTRNKGISEVHYCPLGKLLKYVKFSY